MVETDWFEIGGVTAHIRVVYEAGEVSEFSSLISSRDAIKDVCFFKDVECRKAGRFIDLECAIDTTRI